MTRVIAISDLGKEQLVKSGLPEDKVVVRYWELIPGDSGPMRQPEKSGPKNFPSRPMNDYVNGLLSSAFKNPQVLVETCSLLKKRSIPARLFVAGDGEMLPELKELTAQLGVSDRIHWLGNVPDPKSLLQASDVFLLASVGEAFGLVLAEAMACGVPVVGSRSGSLPEVVDDGRTGLLATPLDASSFADAIERLAKNDELRKCMAAEAISRVHDKFGVERAVDETIRIYESLWADGGA